MDISVDARLAVYCGTCALAVMKEYHTGTVCHWIRLTTSVAFRLNKNYLDLKKRNAVSPDNLASV